jgi:hypothetical protein
MSILRQRHAECPSCGHASAHRVAHSLHAERSPELVEELLGERFQRVACPRCGSPYLVESPFVYVDFAAKLWISHLPRQCEPDWRSLEVHAGESFRHALADHAPSLARELAEGFRVRTVFGLSALRDKVLCLRAGLDDHLLEVLKLDLLRRTPGIPFSLASRPRLVRVDEDELVLHSPSPGALLHVARDSIERLSAQSPAWSPVLDALSQGSYVDIGRLLTP